MMMKQILTFAICLFVFGTVSAQKKKAVIAQTMPIIKNIRKEQGNHIENVSVPFTDGKRGVQALLKLDKYFETEGKEMMSALERNITLALIVCSE